MPGNEAAGLNLLGILERLSNVLIKAGVDDGNPFTSDSDLISLGGSDIEKSDFKKMESVLSLEKNAIKNAIARIYGSENNNQIVRVLFQVNNKIFFTYNVESFEMNDSQGENFNLSRLRAQLCWNITWNVLSVETFNQTNNIQLNIRIQKEETKWVIMSLKCKPM